MLRTNYKLTLKLLEQDGKQLPRDSNTLVYTYGMDMNNNYACFVEMQRCGITRGRSNDSVAVNRFPWYSLRLCECCTTVGSKCTAR